MIVTCEACGSPTVGQRSTRRFCSVSCYSRAGNLRKKYGMTVRQYRKRLAEQDGRCAICGVADCKTGKGLAVDHDHSTGAVRGLLCMNCNVGIGALQDDPRILQAAIDYLDRTS